MGGELSGRKGPSANQADADAQEIAQMIGSSRETVTRLLADFRRSQLVQVIGLTLVINNKSALEGIVTG
jgi:CRP-like cAMP-binding protein